MRGKNCVWMKIVFGLKMESSSDEESEEDSSSDDSSDYGSDDYDSDDDTKKRVGKGSGGYDSDDDDADFDPSRMKGELQPLLGFPLFRLHGNIAQIDRTQTYKRF